MILASDHCPFIPPAGPHDTKRLPGLQTVHPDEVELLAHLLDGGNIQPETRAQARAILRSYRLEHLAHLDLASYGVLSSIHLDRLQTAQQMWQRWSTPKQVPVSLVTAQDADSSNCLTI